MSSDEVNLAIEVDADKAISSLEEYIDALEQVEKASDIDLDKVIDALEGTGEGADSAVKPLEDLGKGFEDITDVSGDASKSIEDIAKSFEEGSAASEQLTSTITEAGSGIGEFTSSAESGVGASQELASSLTEGSTSAAELESAVTPLPGVIDETASSTTTLDTELQAIVESFTGVNESSAETTSVVTEAGGAFTEVASVATEATTSVTEFSESNIELGTSVGTTTEALAEENTLLGEFSTVSAEAATGTTDLATGMTDLATGFEETTTASETAATGLESFNTNIGNSVGFIGSAASSSVGLVTGFVRLDQAQNRVAASAVKVSKQQEALVKAQDKLNTLRASGTANAQELAQAELDVQQASESLAVSEGRLENQQTNLNLRMTEFYATIGPQIIQTATGIAAGFAQFPQAISNITGIFNRLTSGLRGVSGGTNLYTSDLQNNQAELETWGHGLEDSGDSLSTLGNDLGTTTGGLLNFSRAQGQTQTSAAKFAQTVGIVSAVVGAAAVAIGVIASNTFGARDALNSFGETLGNTIPPLEGVLVGIQNFAVDIGIAGDDAKATATKLDETTSVVESFGAAWETTFTQMSRSTDPFIATVGDSMNQIGTKFKDVTANIQSETSNWISAFNEFGAALQQGDYSKALDLIVAGFRSVGVVALDVMSVVGTALEEGLTMLGAWVVEWAGPAIVGLATEAGTRLGEALLAGLEFLGNTVKTFVHDNITQHFINLGTSIQAELGKYGAFWSKTFATFVTTAETAVNSVVTAVNGIATDITNQAAAFWTNSGLGEFFDKAVNTAVSVGQQIAAALIPKGGTPAPETPPEQGGGGPRGQRPRTEGQAPATAGPRSFKEAADAIKQLTPALNQATTSFGSFSIAEAKAATEAGGLTTVFRPFTTNLTGVAAASGRGSVALGKLGSVIRPFTSNMSGAAEATGRGTRFMYEIGSSAQSAVAPTTALTGNFARAASVMPGFNTALSAAGNVVTQLPPQFKAYGEAIQTADDRGISLTQSVLKSIPATVAAGNAISQNTSKTEQAVGAAIGYIASQGRISETVGLTNDQILLMAHSMETEATAREGAITTLADELGKRQAAAQAAQDQAAEYIGLANAQKNTAAQNEAINATFDPLIEGMRLQNENTRAIQQAYTQLTPATLSQIVAYQREAQALELGNILKEGSNAATIALAQAQTEGVKSGVEFANSQFTAQSSLEGYRQALSFAISGNTEYANSLGLTTDQLERYLSFQNDVVAAQEEIIESIATVVDAMVVNNRAWETMSQAQLENLAGLVEYRMELISLQQPLADTNENLFKLAQAYLDGMQAANDFVLGLRTSAAETEGYRTRLVALIGDMSGFPALLEQNTQNLEAFAQATLGAGQAAVDAGQQMAEAWVGLFPAATSILDSLVEAFGKSGEEQRDALESAWEGLGEDLDDLVGDDVKETFEKMAEGIDTLQTGVDAFQIHSFVGEIDKGREVLKDAAEEAKEALPDAWSIAFDEIDSIIATGTPQQINEMMNIIKTGADPSIVEGQLQRIVDKFAVGGSNAARAFMEKVRAGIQQPDTLIEDKGPIPSNIAALSPEPFQPKGAAADPFAAIVAGAKTAESAIQQSITRIQSMFETGLVQHAITAGTNMGNNLGINFNTTLGQNLAITAQMFATTFNTVSAGIMPLATTAAGNYTLAFNTALVAGMTVTAQMFALTFSTISAQIMPLATVAAGNYTLAFNTALVAGMTVTAQMFLLTFNTISTGVMPLATTAANNYGLAFNTALGPILALTAQMFVLTLTTITTQIPQYAIAAATAYGNAFVAAIGPSLALAAQMFANVMAQIQASIAATPIVPVVDILPAGQQLAVLVTTINSIKQTVIPPITVNTVPALTLINGMQAAIDAVKQNKVPPMTVDTQPGLKLVAALQKAIDAVKQNKVPKVTVDVSEGISNVRKLQSEINSLKGKNVTSTHTIRTVRTGAQHGFEGIVTRPTPFMVGEHGKPEFVSVTPLTNPNNNTDKTIDLGRLSGVTTAAPTGLQQGGRILSVPQNSGACGKDMRQLLDEVKNLGRYLRNNKMQISVNLDGKRVDERIQIRRAKRIGDFG